MTLLLVYGTRPEAIKLGPVAAELKAQHVPFHVLCTGQHTSLLAGTPAETDLAGASSLGLASTGNVLRYLEFAELEMRHWLEDRPDYDVVVVQGDTMSALAAARAGAILERTVAHVEAGVRSFDPNNPWPEENSRTEITRLAEWHYAPTAFTFANLLKEGVRHERVRLTGNTVVSALARYTAARPVGPQPHVLITMHRREWLHGPDFEETIAEFKQQAKENPQIQFVWPMHPAVRARANMLTQPPLPYAKCAEFLASSMGVITDSGGLQEEAAALGVPCCVLRHACDRPESIEDGTAKLFTPDAYGVRSAVACLTQGGLPRRPSDVFGDTTAAAQVARCLSNLLD